MNCLKFSYLLLGALLLQCNVMNAGLKIPMGTHEVLLKTADLPDTEEFLIKKGHYLDLATLHEEYNIAYLPLWITKDPKIVGFDKIDDTYYEIPDEDLDLIISSQKLDKAELVKLPFFHKYGGKLIALVIIVAAVWGYLPSKKEKAKSKDV